MPPYDEKSGEGLVRHVLIRTGFDSGEIMVCLVLNYRKKTEERMSGKNAAFSHKSKVSGKASFAAAVSSYLPHQ